MKKFLITCIIILSFFINYAQNPTFVWAKQMNDGVNSIGTGSNIVTDALGYVYCMGTFDHTNDFDTGPGTYNLTSYGLNDVFICKMDSAGNFIWAKQIGGIDEEYGNSIVVDALGNVYVTGYFLSAVDFDPGPTTFTMVPDYEHSMFIVKLDASGNFIWAKQPASNDESTGTCLALDNNSNIYISGTFHGIVDFDPGPATYTLNTDVGGQFYKTNGYVCKLDASGNFIWVKKIGHGGEVKAKCMKIDNSGNIYVSGSFYQTCDFDPGAGTYNMTGVTGDSFILKLNSAGNFLWAGSVVSGGNSQGFAMAIDGEGYIYGTGIFKGTPDFDPGPAIYAMTSNTMVSIVDSYIFKLETSGNFVWAKQITGTRSSRPFDIALDANGNIFTTGWFYDIQDFDPGPGTFTLASAGGNSAHDNFISKYTNSGNFIWTGRVGLVAGGNGVGNYFSRSISIDNWGNIYTIGEAQLKTDFDPGPATYTISSGLGSDIFILKLRNSIINSVKENSLEKKYYVYPNPTKNKLTIESSGNLTISILNILGQEVLRTKVEKIKDIDVSDFINGVYIIKDQETGNISRFIKE